MQTHIGKLRLYKPKRYDLKRFQSLFSCVRREREKIGEREVRHSPPLPFLTPQYQRSLLVHLKDKLRHELGHHRPSLGLSLGPGRV